MHNIAVVVDCAILWVCHCSSCMLVDIWLYFDWHFSEAVRPSEALDVANVIYSVVTYCPMSVITQLPSDIITEFFSCLSRVTCEFCRVSADESVCCYSCDVLLLPCLICEHDAFICVVFLWCWLPKSLLWGCLQFSMALCGLWGCKNRLTLFAGQRS